MADDWGICVPFGGIDSLQHCSRFNLPISILVSLLTILFFYFFNISIPFLYF
jgi:hypothetical protein